MITTTQIGVVADNTSTSKSGNVISIKDDGVGKAKLNADIVGIETATGKINTINSTNFKSLDGTNLTGAGDIVKIADVTQASANAVMESGVLDLSAYKLILVTAILDISGSQQLFLHLNSDTTAANYDSCYVDLQGDAHTVTANNNSLALQDGTKFKVLMFMRNTSGEPKDINMQVSFDTVSAIGSSIHMTYSDTTAITKIGFSTHSAETIADTSIFTIYGFM